MSNCHDMIYRLITNIVLFIIHTFVFSVILTIAISFVKMDRKGYAFSCFAGTILTLICSFIFLISFHIGQIGKKAVKLSYFRWSVLVSGAVCGLLCILFGLELLMSPLVVVVILSPIVSTYIMLKVYYDDSNS